MKSSYRVGLALALLVFGAPSGILAQTPKLEAAPDLTLKWLKSLTISPATVSDPTVATATITLLRPAIRNMTIMVELVGGPQDETFSYMNGVSVLRQQVIGQGQSQRTFRFSGNEPITLGPITVRVSYGQETQTATLTLVRSKRVGIP
jgi:hypothetical protein